MSVVKKTMPNGYPAMVRQATSGDAGAVSALSLELGYPASVAQMRERLDLLLSDGNHEILVAIRSDGSELVGWVHVFVRELLMLERHAEIGGLVVAEGQRGRGIGHLLMAEAERWARRKECTAVYVHSNVERQDAHQFYHVLGYGQVKTQGVFRKSL